MGTWDGKPNMGVEFGMWNLEWRIRYEGILNVEFGMSSEFRALSWNANASQS
jgi:hypothetical protein